ncbi:MAG TPA: plastocyanin/azurin family copper-binding protein [Acidimicrobiales bacterium]|nr:plastocyanin/azurin family copper-binding protein [Acidimicrobiales bacterium]
MNVFRRSFLLVLLATTLLSACGGGDGAASAPEEDRPMVTVETFDFQPDPFVVPAGTTITFLNKDAIDHTVTAGTRENPTPEVFDGELPEKGSTFELTLDEPGTYDYFCEIHPGPGMTATVTVE